MYLKNTVKEIMIHLYSNNINNSIWDIRYNNKNHLPIFYKYKIKTFKKVLKSSMIGFADLSIFNN